MPPERTASTGPSAGPVAVTVSVIQQGGDGDRSGRFDKQFLPFQQQQHGSGDHLLADRDDLVDQPFDDLERHVTGSPDRDAVRHRAHRGQRQRLAGGERGREGGGRLGLDPDQADLRTLLLDHCRDAGHQPAAAHAHQHRLDGWQLLQQLQADGALTGNDVLVVEGMDQDRAAALLPGQRLQQALVDGVAGEETSAP